MTQVDRLSSLLSRVQANRNARRPERSAPLMAAAAQPAPRMSAAGPAPAARPVAAVAAKPERERGSVVEEHVHLPNRSSVAQARPAASQPARQPVRDRTATPLEMALEGDLGRPLEAPVPKVAAARKPTEPSMAAVRPTAGAALSDEPFVVEPEPLREPTRPIAQVMSKQSLEMDITFGAMLKRSLSLRPR